MPMPAGDVRFGPFRLDAAGFRLLRGDTPVPLTPKALDLLFLLASRPAALVSKDEVARALWPDVAVTDNALTQLVSDLRQALGDSAAAPQYIQTVPRRGYRFVAALDAPPPPAGARETSNLEALRALTDGRIKLEAMDPAVVPSAMVDFNRAIALDPAYSAAYVGRAHARFWRYEATRAQNRPDTAELRAAVADARRAVELDADFAEAHSALALFLTSASRPAEAVAFGRRAVALEPASWRHWFRLGVAAWGSERVRCCERVITSYPELAHAYFALAMVHVARGALDPAGDVLRRGLERQQDRPVGVDRLPGRGLHWLLGLTRLASGDAANARAEFDRELESTGGELYAAEYVMDAYDGHGFACLRLGDAVGAARMFGRALEVFPGHARSLVGLAEAHRRAGRGQASEEAAGRARAALDELGAGGRTAEALMAAAQLHATRGRPHDAVTALDALFAETLPPYAGWTIPVEPLLEPLHGSPPFDALLHRLAERAR